MTEVTSVVGTENEIEVVEVEVNDVVVEVQQETQVVETTDQSYVVSPQQETTIISVATQGPTGPTGPQGEQGIQGEQGPIGYWEDQVPQAKKVDFVNDNLLYTGVADVGAAAGDPVWRISKTTIASDDDVEVTWADGTADFIKVWNDRATYTYS